MADEPCKNVVQRNHRLRWITAVIRERNEGTKRRSIPIHFRKYPRITMTTRHILTNGRVLVLDPRDGPRGGVRLPPRNDELEKE